MIPRMINGEVIEMAHRTIDQTMIIHAPVTVLESYLPSFASALLRNSLSRSQTAVEEEEEEEDQ